MKSWQKIMLAGLLAATICSCNHAKNITSASPTQAEPAKVLLDHGLETLEQKKYAVAVTLLETLLKTYPDSRYVEQAKRALDNCSLVDECRKERKEAEALPNGGGMTFFPNLPEDKNQKPPRNKR